MALRKDDVLTPVEFQFYAKVLRALVASEVPFLVGGAYALSRYSRVTRHTKDLDVFIKAKDWERIQNVMATMNYSSELTFPHWLGKAFNGDNFIDLIFSSGNGRAIVDDFWFERSAKDYVMGVEVSLVPAEEMIWQKAYIMERERFDGADIAHLINACGTKLDWQHLLKRFDRDYRVLLSHLMLFGFIYPAETDKIPKDIMLTLLNRLKEDVLKDESAETESSAIKTCYGTLLSREQYLIDVQDWGYKDARLQPIGNMTKEQITHWTAAIDRG